MSLTCGAEPIRAATVERVLQVFGAAGLHPHAFAPSYGLAEAVLGVSSTLDAAPRIVSADAAALRAHRFEAVADTARDARRLVGCGRAIPGTEILIVEDGRACVDGEIGEIWVRSPSVGEGYWMQPEASDAVFGGHLADGAGPYLRTGDLGFLDRGELFVTGRLKDLVIVHGENHYPQDLEWSAERAHPDLRVGHGVAFPIDTPGGEAVVLALELERRAFDADTDAVFRAVRRAIAVEHGLPLHAVALVRAGALPRTSSGKIQRHRCREAFLAGALPLAAPLDTGGDEAMALDDEALASTRGASRLRAAARRARARHLGHLARSAGHACLRRARELLRTRRQFAADDAGALAHPARFDVELPLAELFEHASVAAMAARWSGRPRPAATPRMHGRHRARGARRCRCPTSLSQRRMWVIQHFDPGIDGLQRADRDPAARRARPGAVPAGARPHGRAARGPAHRAS